MLWMHDNDDNNDDKGVQQCDNSDDDSMQWCNDDSMQQCNDDDQGAPKMPPRYLPARAKNPGIMKSYNTNPSGYTSSIATTSSLVLLLE
jgi:hypothetical protein